MKVGEQWKTQPARLNIGFVAPHSVDRDAQQLRAVLAEFRQHLVVKRELIAADRTPVRRIEGEDHRSALQLAERQILIRRHAQCEPRSGGADGENLRHRLAFLVPCLRQFQSERT